MKENRNHHFQANSTSFQNKNFSTPQKAIFTPIHPQEQLNTKIENPQPQNP